MKEILGIIEALVLIGVLSDPIRTHLDLIVEYALLCLQLIVLNRRVK
jgi:hypothetical protein